MDASIVIVNWNTRELLRACLETMPGPGRAADDATAPSIEVIVVDNASADGSADMVRAAFPHVRLIANDENVGFAAANNQAIDVARGRVIVLLNSDTELVGDVIERAIQRLDALPDVAVLGGHVLESDRTTTQPTCFREPRLVDLAIVAAGLHRLRRPATVASWLGRQVYAGWPRDTARDVEVVTGCFMVVRRTALDAVGPLDPSFFFYGEEAEWCGRFRDAGWRVRYEPIDAVVHHGGASTLRIGGTRARLLAGGLVQLLARRRGPAVAAAARAIIASGAIVRLIIGAILAALAPTSRTRTAGRRLTRVGWDAWCGATGRAATSMPAAQRAADSSAQSLVGQWPVGQSPIGHPPVGQPVIEPVTHAVTQPVAHATRSVCSAPDAQVADDADFAHVADDARTANRDGSRAAKSLAPAPPTLARRAAHGAAWQIAGRGGEQLVRFGTNLLAARLLAPDDFGRFGMAAVGLAIADAAAFMGIDQAVVVERRGDRPRFVATAWACALLRGFGLAIVLLALAPFLAGLLGAPDDSALFAVIALQPILVAAAHPGAYVLVRRLQFRRWTTARFVAAMVGAAATVLGALVWRDAWGLVVGHLVGTAAIAVGAFVVTPSRLRVAPRLDRAAARRVLRFSAGAVGTPLLIVLILQAPVLFLGPTLGAAVLGIYVLNRRLADIATTLAKQAVGFVLTPMYADLRDEPDRFRRAWTRILGLTARLVLPPAALAAWLDADAGAILFGSAYAPPIGVFACLALAASLTTLIAVSGSAFWGAARPGLDRSTQLGRVVVLLGLGVVLVPALGALGLAAATLVSAVTGLAVVLSIAHRVFDVRLAASMTALAPSLAAAMALWLAGVVVDRTLTPDAAHRLGIALAAAALWITVHAGRAARELGLSVPDIHGESVRHAARRVLHPWTPRRRRPLSESRP